MTRKLAIVVFFSLFTVAAELAPVTFAREDTGSSGHATTTTDAALYNLADKLAELLGTIRDVIAINQLKINTCSIGNHYDFKGLTPSTIGTQVGNYFNMSTGIRMKQTSLRLRNLKNAPDAWEAAALEMFEDPDYPVGSPYTEIVERNGGEVYRFIKPVYIGKECLRCHGERETIREDILEYLETHYPQDMTTGYKVGDLRGGISITIPIVEQGLSQPHMPNVDAD
ncbi:MAG: Tll0287-like domain-containing protein [Planctomycetota bacterium]